MLAMLAWGCETSDGGGATPGPPETTLLVTGTLPLDATSATAVFGASTCQVAGASVGVAHAVLVASDQAGFCGYLQQGQDRAGRRSIEVTVVRVDPTSPTTSLAADTYPIVSSPSLASSYALLVVSDHDAACQPVDVTGTSGVVFVTSADPLQGSIWATLSDGGRVIGPFDAGTCAAALAGDACAGSVGLSISACAP